MDTRSRLPYVAAMVVLGLVAAQDVPARAQLPPTTPATGKLSAAEQTFDRVALQFETALRQSGGFVADIVSTWESRGSGGPNQGTNIFHVVAADNGKLRVEAGSKETEPGQLICVSDGRTMTRYYKPKKIYSQQPVSGDHDDIPHDAFTMQTLTGSGVDFLIRPRFRADLIAQITGVEFKGEETIRGARTRHFFVQLINDRTYDVWFQTGDQPLLMRVDSSYRIPIREGETFELNVSNAFSWKVGESLPPNVFQLKLPRDAHKVNDLLTALQQGDIEQLLGKKAPTVRLQDLDGHTVDIASHRGRNVVVLILWASWCAPSVNDMASLNQFISGYQDKGVAIYAVNLGESKNVVAQAIRQRTYSGPVLLDPQATTLRTFGIGAIPATVLISKEGTVQSYHMGSSDEVRTLIRKQVDRLLAGQTLLRTRR